MNISPDPDLKLGRQELHFFSIPWLHWHSEILVSWSWEIVGSEVIAIELTIECPGRAINTKIIISQLALLKVATDVNLVELNAFSIEN